MSDEYLSNIKIQLQTSASPEAYSNLENPEDGVTVGESTPLLRVTNLSDTSERYIGGLADGDEFSVTCNRLRASPSVQDQLIAAKGLTKSFRVVSTDRSVSPHDVEHFIFDAVVLGWSLQPGIGEAAKIVFNFKISGGVTHSVQ